MIWSGMPIQYDAMQCNTMQCSTERDACLVLNPGRHYPDERGWSFNSKVAPQRNNNNNPNLSGSMPTLSGNRPTLSGSKPTLSGLPTRIIPGWQMIPRGWSLPSRSQIKCPNHRQDRQECPLCQINQSITHWRNIYLSTYPRHYTVHVRSLPGIQ